MNASSVDLSPLRRSADALEIAIGFRRRILRGARPMAELVAVGGPEAGDRAGRMTSAGRYQSVGM
jgi:hypothetical protein